MKQPNSSEETERATISSLKQRARTEVRARYGRRSEKRLESTKSLFRHQCLNRSIRIVPEAPPLYRDELGLQTWMVIVGFAAVVVSHA